MTLKQIKAMFAPGQTWQATRTGQALVVNGNLGQTVLPANNVQDELRVVKAVKSGEVVWLKPDGRDIHMTWPKAGEVQEAWERHLVFAYDNGVQVKLEQL